MNCTTKKCSINKLALAVTAALAISSATSIHAESKAKTAEFNIQQGTLKTALMEIGESAGVNIVFYGDISSDLNFSGLQGEYSLSQALETVLKGTGLTFEFTDNEAVLIKDNEAKEDKESYQKDVDEELVVTGTRLNNSNVSPSSPVTVIDRAMIEKRGFTSVEDIVRSLPQNVASRNSASFTDGTTLRQQGAIDVNLRGLGSDNTLVLVNGKRIGSTPTYVGNPYTDVSTIPFAAIERVEIMSDGGAALYGADAVAGVVNIILKKDYQGAETSLRVENSLSGGDSYSLDQTFGFGWDSGNLTGALGYRETKPVNSAKAGIESRDLRTLGGRDRRLIYSTVRARGIPGTPAGAFIGGLPAGDGTNVTVADINWISLDEFRNRTGEFYDSITPQDSIPLELTPENREISSWLTVSQELTDQLTGSLGVSYSKRESGSGTTRVAYLTNSVVPTSNAYNNLGAPVRIAYLFENETVAGELAAPNHSSENERLEVFGGLQVELPFGDWQANVDVGYSENTANNVGGGDFALRGSSEYDLFQAALASSDPNTAVNLFGDGSVQPVDLNTFITPQIGSGVWVNSQKTLELGARGSLVELPAGSAQLAFGVESRVDELDFTQSDFIDPLGAVPESKLKAGYLEFAIPVVGESNALPGIQELGFTLAGRYESYKEKMIGDTGTIEGEYGTFVPKVGVSWYPIDDLKLRSTWSGGFKSPGVVDMFTPQIISGGSTIRDPLNPDFNGGPDVRVPVTLIFGGNPNLKEEHSKTITIGFDYTPESLPGLLASVTWMSTEITDLIGSPTIAGIDYMLANSDQFSNVVRDEDGILVSYSRGKINLSRKKHKAVDFNLGYSFENNLGDWRVGMMGTYTGELSYEFAPGLPPVDQDGFEVGPDRWKGFGFVEWYRDNWGANLFVNRSSGWLRDPFVTSTEQVQVKDHSTVDTQIQYETSDGLKLAFGVKNLFDADYPFVDRYYGLDTKRVDTRRRIIYLTAKKSFDF